MKVGAACTQQSICSVRRRTGVENHTAGVKEVQGGEEVS